MSSPRLAEKNHNSGKYCKTIKTSQAPDIYFVDDVSSPGNPPRPERDITQDLEREFQRPKPTPRPAFRRLNTPVATKDDPALTRRDSPVQAVRDIRDLRSQGTQRDPGTLGLQDAESERRSPSIVAPSTSNVKDIRKMAALTPSSHPRQGIKDIRNMAARPSPSSSQQGIKDVRSMAVPHPGMVDLRSLKAALPPADRPLMRPGAIRPAFKARGSVQERSAGAPRGRVGYQPRADQAAENIGDRSILRRENRTKRHRSLVGDADAKAEGPQYSEEEMAYMKDRDEALEPKETPYIPAVVTLESLAEYMPSLATGTMGMQHTIQRGFDKMIFNASLSQSMKAPSMEFLSLDEARERDALIARKEKEKDEFEPKPLNKQQLDLLLGKLLPEIPDVSEQAKDIGGGQIVAKLLQQVNRNPSYTSEDSMALAKRFKGLLPGTTTAKVKPVARAS